jgi:hypothetical protein
VETRKSVLTIYPCSVNVPSGRERREYGEARGGEVVAEVRGWKSDAAAEVEAWLRVNCRSGAFLDCGRSRVVVWWGMCS